MNCYVVKTQPQSGRLEASLTKPKERNLLLEEAMRPREGLIDITTLTTGQALKGTVIAVIRHAAFVSCGVGRTDPNPKKQRLNADGTEQLLQPINGYLMQSDLVKGVALETQLVMREDTTRVIRVGDTIECWVKKAWPTEARYCVTLDESITPETVAALSKQNMKVSINSSIHLHCMNVFTIVDRAFRFMYYELHTSIMQLLAHESAFYCTAVGVLVIVLVLTLTCCIYYMSTGTS
jgi:hypothetical protein